MPRTTRRVRREDEIDEGPTPRIDYTDPGDPYGPPPPPTDPAPVVDQDDLDMLGEGDWVRVSRVGPNGDLMLVKKIERRVLGTDITYIGRTWGGGQYTLEVQDKFRHWGKQKQVFFDPAEYGPPKGQSTVKTATGTPAATIIEAGGTDPVIAAQLRSMEERLAAKDREISALNERMVALQADNHKTVLEMITRMQERSAAGGISPEQIAELIRAATANRAPSDGLSDVVKSVMPLLAEGFKEFLARPIRESRGHAAPAAAGADNSTPLERLAMPFLNTLLPVIARGVAAQQTAKVVLPPHAPSKPAVAPTAPASATGLPSSNGTNGHAPVEGARLVETIKAHPMTKMIAPMLLNEAARGTPVERVAEQVSSLVPDAYWSVVEQLVVRDDLVEYLSVFEPGLAQHGDWLRALAKTLREEYIEGHETDDDAEDEGDDGNDGDTAPEPKPVAVGGGSE
jgi:hypothetical protein